MFDALSEISLLYYVKRINRSVEDVEGFIERYIVLTTVT